MTIFIVFLISLCLVAFLLSLKGYEISSGRKSFLAGYIFKTDLHLLKIFLKIKLRWGHVNFKNTKIICSWIIVSIKKIIIAIKRRFDHKQAHFFTRKDNASTKANSSPSFFLKDVSEYKKSLREGTIDNDN